MTGTLPLTERLSMRLAFRAINGGFEDENGPTYCLICSVEGADADGVEHYLTLQRGFENEDPSEDSGVHFEFDSQINGAYDCVKRCQLTRTFLDVELVRPIDWQKKYDGVSMDVSGLSQSTLATISKGLARIFRSIADVLEIVQ